MIISHTAEESHFTDNVAFSLWRGRPYRYIYIFVNFYIIRQRTACLTLCFNSPEQKLQP